MLIISLARSHELYVSNFSMRTGCKRGIQCRCPLTLKVFATPPVATEAFLAGEVVLALVPAPAAVVGVGLLVDALPAAAIFAERALGGARAALVVQKRTCVPAGLGDAHSAAGSLLEEREPLLALVVGAGALAAQVDRPPQTSPLHRRRRQGPCGGLIQQEAAHAMGSFSR